MQKPGPHGWRRKSKAADELDDKLFFQRQKHLETVRKQDQARVFTTKYMETNSVSDAAKAAHISTDSGRQLLQVPEVRAKIEEGLSAAAQAAGVSKIWVIQKLKEIADRAMCAEPVLDKSGNETGLYVFDAKGATRAIELIGKHVGVFQSPDDSAAAQLGNAVIRVLAQEAQTARLASVDTTADAVSGPIPLAQGTPLAPGEASGRPDERSNRPPDVPAPCPLP